MQISEISPKRELCIIRLRVSDENGEEKEGGKNEHKKTEHSRGFNRNE